MPEDIRAALPALIAEAQRDLEPARDDEIMVRLAMLSAGLCIGMSEKEKTEWQAFVCFQVSKLPRGLALEGLEHAGETCDSPRQVVKAVFAYAGEYPGRSREHLRRLEALRFQAKGE